MSEHIAKVCTGGRAWWGYCQTCGWEGMARWTRIEATHDATAHADRMTRGEEPAEGTQTA